MAETIHGYTAHDFAKGISLLYSHCATPSIAHTPKLRLINGCPTINIEPSILTLLIEARPACGCVLVCTLGQEESFGTGLRKRTSSEFN